VTSLPTPRAVLFDVDFTLLEPNEMFFAEGYRSIGERFGLDLDTARWPAAESAAYAAVKTRRERTGLAHDDGIYEAIAVAVIGAMGAEDLDDGHADKVVACAAAVTAEWVKLDNFALYDDVLPCLERLRDAGLRLALVSNTSRDLGEVLAHFALETFMQAAVASSETGLMKPSPQIYAAAAAALGVGAGEAVMVGDNPRDDVLGALDAGLAGAVLLDRKGHWDYPVPTIRSLTELPGVLGI